MLETSWTALQSAVAKAPDLDALVQAHDAYLRRIAVTAFLTPDKARLHAALQAVRGLCVYIYVSVVMSKQPPHTHTPTQPPLPFPPPPKK